MGKKGKARNGRAKQKQKAQSHGSQHHMRGPGVQPGYSDDDDTAHTLFRGFAIKGAAGVMSRPVKHRHQPLGEKLYLKTITFVPASTSISQPQSEPETVANVADVAKGDDKTPEMTQATSEDTDAAFQVPQSDMARMQIGDSLIVTTAASEVTATTDSSHFKIIGDDTGLDGRRAELGSPEALPFVIDTTGDQDLSRAINQHPMRSQSPAPSDSSEEVVLFHGRGRPTVIDDPISRLTSDTREVSLPVSFPHRHITDDLMRALQSEPDLVGSWAPKSSASEAQSSKWVPAPDTPYWRNKETTVDGLSTLKVGERKASTTVKTRRGKRGKKPKTRAGNDSLLNIEFGLSEDGASDAGSEAAYDDYMANLLAQMEEDPDPKVKSRMTTLAVSGPSLVVDGREIADDEVLPDATRYGNSDEWEDEDDDDDSSSDDHADPDDLSSFDSSDLEDELEYTERQQWEDEADLRQRRIERMTDSRLARLLAKQSELGIDDEDLIIEDGDFDEISDGIGDVEAARVGLLEITNRRSSKRSTRNRGGKGKNGLSYPDASALADTLEQYGDEAFDIMDMDRPSLRPTKKGRKGKIPEALEELSDEELKLSMASTWDKDRAKKRQKKLEREELRREGLLGRRGGTVDLKQKYATGMTTSHVHYELEVFIRDDSVEQRAFPPMFKHDRKALHDACNRLGLTSKSQGAGNSRFTVVSKTLRTVSPGDVQPLLGRGGSRRMSKKQLNDTSARRGGGGFSKSAASFRNGEVVGAGVPELGSENKGHRLLEKMGWTKGMALGKDGEGRLLPVEQIVRIGTAGLGGSR